MIVKQKREREMPKINPQNIKPDWSRYERTPPWSYISSAELAKILGVHLQTISNWRLRGILPEPDSHPRLRGNKRYYRISKVMSWLSGRDEEEITMEWIKKYMPTGTSNIASAQWYVQKGHKSLGVEKGRFFYV